MACSSSTTSWKPSSGSSAIRIIGRPWDRCTSARPRSARPAIPFDGIAPRYDKRMIFPPVLAAAESAAVNPTELCDLSAPVVFFPVRHHSPAAARLVTSLAHRLRPRAILIEGPVDYNDRLHELLLPHRLPLAIYSFVRLPGGLRRGAYYPLCEH